MKDLKVDDKDIPDNTNEIRLVVVGKSESLRLPYFLEYYRDLGVDRFLYFDHNSTDNSVEFMASQADVHVWKSKPDMDFRYKDNWVNYLLNEHCNGNWVICADVDELLTFQDNMPVRDMTDILDQKDMKWIRATLVDMHGRYSLEKAIPKPSHPYIKTCPYFYSDNNLRREVVGDGTCIQKIPLIKWLAPHFKICPGFHSLMFNKQGKRRYFRKQFNNYITRHATVMHFKFMNTLFGQLEELAKSNHLYGQDLTIQYLDENTGKMITKERPDYREMKKYTRWWGGSPRRDREMHSGYTDSIAAMRNRFLDVDSTILYNKDKSIKYTSPDQFIEYEFMERL